MSPRARTGGGGRRVLAIVDRGATHDALATQLAELECEAALVDRASEATRRVDEGWDVVVVDAALAADDGFRLVRALRVRLGPDVPIVVMTPLGDVQARCDALGQGADDFLVTPPTALELGVRLGQALRLRALAVELEAAREALALSALGDPATGLFSARALADRLASELARARRYRRPLAVLVARFERPEGDGEGDRRIAALGQGLRAALRQTDFVARAGRDEVAVVAPETSSTSAAALLDRLAEHLAGLGLVGLATGLATSDHPLAAGADEFLAVARRALRTR